MERLVLYAWPGNVRQLQNEIRRIVSALPGNQAHRLLHIVVHNIDHALRERLSTSSAKPSDMSAPPGEKLTGPVTHRA